MFCCLRLEIVLSFSAETKNQVLISDHSSNGTWISSGSGETIKLEHGKPTLLKEGDVILLTRSTGANPEVISYKYCSSPFPRITKNKEKEEALHQGSGGMLECHTENISPKSDQANTRIHLKRQHEAYDQGSSPRKVRFKVEVEENITNHNPFIGSRVKDEDRSTEGLDDCTGSVTSKGSVAVKELNDTTLYIDKTTALNNDDQGIPHTTTLSSHLSVPPSSTESPSAVSKFCRSDHEKKRESLLEVETTKCEALGQTSDCTAAEDDSVCYDKCVHCGEWIPRVTLSLHEAVCEGQSQEAKSQDHVSLSSLPLGDCSFSGETMSDRVEKCLLDEVQDNISVSDERASEPELTGQVNKGESDPQSMQDETCEKNNIETITTLPSLSSDLPDESTESDIVSTSTVVSCESRGRIEEKTVIKISNASPEQRQLLLGSHSEDDGSTSPHQCEPTISREESKERCTFCSKVLPVSELMAHASECSKISAVPRTDSDNAENMREACPYCGEYFEVVKLVEHVTRCSEVSRLIAEEISLEDSSPSSSVAGAADCTDDPSVGDRELCPKCLREFSVLELLNHADECKEPLSASSDVESSLEDAKDLIGSIACDGDKGIEKVVDNDSKDGIGHEVCEPESWGCLDYDKSKCDGHIPSSDASGGDEDDQVAEADHHVGGDSAFDQVNRDEDREDEEGEVDDDDNDDDDDDDDDDKSSRGGTDDGDVTRGDSYYDDYTHSDRSSISNTNDEDSKSDEGDDKSDEHSTHTNKDLENKGTSGIDDYVDVVPIPSVPSDEFELCPNCFQPFHLSRLVEHASNCVNDASAMGKAVETATATDFKKSSLIHPSSESMVAFFNDCPFCGVKLPVDVMSEHYPRCKNLHSQRIISEGSVRIKKRDPVEGFPEHAFRTDNLSTRTIVKHERAVKCLASSTKTSDEASKSSNIKVAKLQDAADDDHREAGESEVSLKKTTSSLDSYHDCEEQCMYCLKMFAVSVLVEHVCSCADRYEVRFFTKMFHQFKVYVETSSSSHPFKMHIEQ